MSILSFARTAALALACVCLASGSAAAQTLNKSSLSFGNVAIGSAGDAKTVTLKNTRSVPLSIASITASNGFVVAAGSTCPLSPATLAAGASCFIAAAFAPAALGAASGAVTITHNAPSSPQTVALAGTGIEPVVVSTTALVFSNTVAGAVSATKNVTITNKLNTPLAFTSIVVSPSYFGIASSTCGATLAAGANCVVVVRFQPVSIGALTGSLTFTHNAVTSPHVVSLSGTATPPLTGSTNSLTFPSQGIGTASTALLVTLRNRTAGSLTVGVPWTSGDFAVSATTCLVLAANATCTVSVRFTPTALGNRLGTLTVPFTGPGSPLTLALDGQGNASSVQSIAVTPINPEIVESDSQPFTATGSFPGGAHFDISTLVVWASADTAVATISNAAGSKGVATGLTAGTSSISATLGAISGSTLLKVTPLRQLLSIELTPADSIVLRGATTQLTATGHFSDDTTEDLTQSAEWSSTVPAAATVGNVAGSKGLVSALAADTATIQATVGVVTGTTSYTVNSYFSTTGSLSVPRDAAVSVLLNDGRVLVAGGWPSGATAEVYDRGTQSFVSTGPRTFSAIYNTGTLLPGGKVLIAGGYDWNPSGPVASAELYDPVSGSFTATGSLQNARSSHTATRLPDGRVLLVGGIGAASTLATAELYDPSTGLFTPTGSLSVARASHVAVPLLDGRVLIAGGMRNTEFLTSAEIFDPATGTFSLTAPMALPRYLPTALRLDDGRALVIGGYTGNGATATAEIYDPGVATFTQTGPMLASRGEMVAALLTNGTVLVAGGWGGSGDSLPSVAELFDPATGTFESAGEMNTARANAVIALLGDGSVLIAGGDNDSPAMFLSSAELFTPSSLEPDGLVSIEVTPVTPTIAPGAVLHLTATGTFSDGSSRVLGSPIWSSGSPAQVAVSNDPGSRGFVTALAAGESEITATVGGISGATTVTVLTPLAVSEISPPDGLTGVARSTAISVTFNSGILAATLTTNTANTLCTGSLQVSADDFATCVQMSLDPSHVGGNQYSVQPALSLLAGTTYRVRVTTALQDAAGQALSTAFTSTGFTTDSPSLVSFALSPDTIDHALGLFAPFPQLTAVTTFSDGSTADVTASVTWSVAPAHVGVFDASVPGMLRIGGTGNAVVTATMGALTATASLVSTSPAPTVVNGHLVTGLTHLRRDSMTVTKLPDGRVLIAGGLNDVTGATSSAELFDPAADTLTATLPMSVVRQNHTATLLADGRVLVAGGYGGELLSSAEIFNPATGAWTSVAAMNMGRTGHVAVRVDTKVLVAGGDWNGGTSAELFDPATGLWTPTGSLNVGSSEGTAVVLPDGRVLLAGGVDPSNPRWTGEVYNPVSGLWTLTGNLIHARYAHTLTLLASGKVLITGGIGDLGASTTAEIYDSAANTWSLTGDLPSPLLEHSATLLSSGQVLIAGFNNETLYDPATGTFSVGAPLVTTRFKHAALRLDDGRVLLVGGVNEPATVEVRTVPLPPEPDLAVVAVQPADSTTGVARSTAIDVTFSAPINVATLTVTTDWQCTGSLQVSGDNFGTCVLMSGPPVQVAANTYRVQPAVFLDSGTIYKVRVTTAVQSSTGQALTAMFTSSGFTTVTVEHLVTGLTHLRPYGTTLTKLDDGRVLIAGGYDDATGSFSSAELFDPTNDTLTAAPPMSAARSFHTATLLSDGRVLVAGGFDGVPQNTAEIFDPTSDSWTPVAAMNEGRAGHVAVLLGTKVLVAGGDWTQDGKSAEIFDPATGAWTSTDSLNVGSTSGGAVVLPDGRVLLAGGLDPYQNRASAEVYDPIAGEWTMTGSPAEARDGSTLTLLQSGDVLLTGGLAPSGVPVDTAEVYDSASGTWAPTGSMPRTFHYHSATLLPSGQVLIAGFWFDVLYEPVTGTFSYGPGLLTTRFNHRAILLDDGRVLLVGGTAAPGTIEVIPPAP